jgi:hypothetical protein
MMAGAATASCRRLRVKMDGAMELLAGGQRLDWLAVLTFLDAG